MPDLTDPPLTKSASSPGSMRTVAEKPSLLGWYLAYWVNTIVPAGFAAMCVQPLGWFGVLAGAVVLCWSVGYVLSHYRWWITPATTGATVVAILQLIPILQIMAGTYALAITTEVPPARAQLSIAQSFLATLITGSELLAFSLVPTGMIKCSHQLLTRRRDLKDHPAGKLDRADPLDEIGY